MSPSTQFPTPKEIYRKLRSPVALKFPARNVTSSQCKATPGLCVQEGTESESDSVLVPVSPISSPSAGPQVPSSPLSGEETEEDDCSGWKRADYRNMQFSESECVIKSGYLWKRGERRKTWKKRWFVLRPAHLAYYKSSAEYQLLRLLELPDIHSCSAIPLKKHPNTLGLVSPVRTFYLQAKTPSEVNDWVEAIYIARQAAMATSTQSSNSPTPKAVASEQSLINISNVDKAPPIPIQHHVTSSESDGQFPSPQELATPPPPPPKDAPRLVLTGYLMKCGSKRRNWRKRWFMLNNDKLAYSASHMDTRPHAEFSFSQIVDALEYDYPLKGNSPSPQMSPQSHSSGSTDDDIVQRDAHIFKIVTTKRTLLLCAPTEEEEVKWLGAISALIARRVNSPGAPKSIPKTPHPETESPNQSPTISGMVKGKSKRPNSLTGGPRDTA